MQILILALVMLCADDKDDAAAAAKKLGEAKSYAFKSESKTEGADRATVQLAKVEGKVQKGAGTWMLTDTTEYVRVGSVTVSRPRSEWRVVEEAPAERNRGRGMGFGRGGPPRPPHDELVDLGAKLAKCRKLEATEEDCAVYEAELTPEAAKEFNPMSRMLDRMGGGDVSGSAKLWVKDGVVVKYLIATKLEAEVQGQAFEMSQTRTVTVSGLDATTVEIPAEAKKLIEKSKREDF